MTRVSWNIIVACIWISTLVELIALSAGDGDAYSDRVALSRMLGWQSAAALVAALSVKAFSHRLRESAKLRRALGLAAVSSACMHAVIAVWNSPLTLAQQLDEPRLRFGFGALLVLLLMGITSFPRVVVWLRLRSWKELHRLVYVAWLCVMLHAFLSPYALLPGVLCLALSVVAAGASYVLVRRVLKNG